MKVSVWIKDGELIPDDAKFVCREERVTSYETYRDPLDGDEKVPVCSMGSIYEVSSVDRDTYNL